VLAVLELLTRLMILAIDDKATPEVQSAAWRGIDEIANDLEALPEVNSYELATRFRFADGQVSFRRDLDATCRE
jgi:hypothetical protein